MNKIQYSDKPLFSISSTNTLILATVSLQPIKDLSETTLQIKAKFPSVFKDYFITTEEHREKRILNNLLGKSYWFGYPDSKQRVALIYVSKKFGQWQDPMIHINKRTLDGLEKILKNTPPSIEIHCDKLNFNNFDALWSNTRKSITALLQKYPEHKFIVHDVY